MQHHRARSELRTAQITLLHRPGANATIAAGLAWAEDGEGTHETLAGLRYAVTF